jgi:purine-binding chemotaxis protein CheW
MSAEKLEALCVRVADRFFAVDIFCIREILRARAVTQIPHAPPELAGVVNLRGELMPVLDLHRVLLARDRPPLQEEARLLVVRGADVTASLLVDQVLDVVSVPLEDLRPMPAATSKTSAVVAAFHKELESGAQEVVLLLRVPPIFRDNGLCVPGGSR